jgi:16S rRNA (uracil1498-N3)-methyltransferase
MEHDIVVSKALLSSTRVGAVVTVRTEEGREYRARVMKVDGQTALVRAFEELCFPAESRLQITLIQALAKKEKMALVIQKATELGVSRIIPCASAKSTVPGGPGKGQDKSHRWPAVAQKAVEQ